MVYAVMVIGLVLAAVGWFIYWSQSGAPAEVDRIPAANEPGDHPSLTLRSR
jgi:hypothetical protein